MKLDGNNIFKLLDNENVDEDTIKELSENDNLFVQYASLKARHLEFIHSTKEETPLEYFNKLTDDFPEISEIIPSTKDASDNPENNETSKILFYYKQINQYLYPLYGIAAAFAISLFVFLSYQSSGAGIKDAPGYIDFRNLNNLSDMDMIKDKKKNYMGAVRGNNNLNFDRPFETSLINLKEEEIIDFARNSEIQIEILYGEEFSQTPKVGEKFNIKNDTLRVIIKQ